MAADDVNAPGASAQRENERRKANGEAKLRAEWGKLGGLAVALSDEKQSTKAWSTGAAGDAAVGARLDGLALEGIRVMHDRRIPRSKANIAPLVVTPGGVWVIDTKRYAGKAPENRVEGGIIRPRVELLIYRGGNKTKLVEGLQKQVEHVRHVVVDAIRARVGLAPGVAPRLQPRGRVPRQAALDHPGPDRRGAAPIVVRNGDAGGAEVADAHALSAAVVELQAPGFGVPGEPLRFG